MSNPPLERWPTALPVEVIGPALARVEVAFCHGNREEAHAAIDQAFDSHEETDVTLDSPIGDLGLPIRYTNSLESAGIATIRDLTEWSIQQLHAIRNCGTATTNMIQVALEKHGWSLQNNLADGYTALQPLSGKQWLEKLARRTA